MVRMHHSRAEGDGRLVEAMRNSDRGHAINWRVLDRGIRHSRSGGFGSVLGECAGDEESAGAQKPRAGESMADEATHLWALAKFVRPSQEIRTMRTYWRQRNDLVQSAGRHIQRIQKALTQMNLQLANVLADVSGMTGQAIINAVLASERDPHKL